MTPRREGEGDAQAAAQGERIGESVPLGLFADAVPPDSIWGQLLRLPEGIGQPLRQLIGAAETVGYRERMKDVSADDRRREYAATAAAVSAILDAIAKK